MKNNKKSLKIDHSLTLYIMLGILIIVISVLFITTYFSIVNNIFFPDNYFYLTFLMIGLVVILVISIVLSYLLSRLIHKYIMSIKTALKNVSDGNFDIQYKPSKNQYINEIITEFNTMVQELNSVPMLRKDFVSNFSHEFKTPLASIKGFAEILQTKQDLTTAEKSEYLQIIIDECTRLSNLANNTLLISKLDSQTKLTNTSKIYLDEQIDYCLFLLDKRIRDANINVTTDLPQTTFVCDQALMQQVWLNILDNAIKFTKNKIIITITQDKDNIIINIEDNGIGINKEAQKHIFEKFYQADPSHSSSGSGLGLATAQKIINLHKGTIRITSIEQEFTRFTITLPNKNETKQTNS